MSRKLPACDPCRAQKLACDHARPVCKRCIERDRPGKCTYRPRPFVRSARRVSESKSPQEPTTTTTVSRVQSTSGDERPSPSLPVQYPNPGYLGSSSHTTLFDQVRMGGSDTISDHDQQNAQGSLSLHSEITLDNDDVVMGAQLLTEIGRLRSLSPYLDLIDSWTSKGSNLALAEPFTGCCALAAKSLLQGFDGTFESAMSVSRSLFEQSLRPIVIDTPTTLESYSRNLYSPTCRWETLGLFFTAACRATADIWYFSPLYGCQNKRRIIQKSCLKLSDRCLDMVLSLDCLNDLQLFLQYENFICHSQTDGDQSYRSWRKLGDVTSSLYTLGYHQLAEQESCPLFLQKLRETAFGRTYSADKNVAIFLGRPPRMFQSFCHPRNHIRLLAKATNSALTFPASQGFDYATDTRWHVICAVLKERILQLFDVENYESRTYQAQLIQADAESHWALLPESYRLDCDVKFCNRRPIERDFMVGAKLNYLHVHFLLRLALLRRASDPDPQLLDISMKMLALVTESVMIKDQMVNSGTSLVWKVVYYGLAAAGVVCLTLISQPSILNSLYMRTSTSRIYQDLSILVAEVERGTLVHVETPNYALLSRATRTIQNLLNRLFMIPSSGPEETLETIQPNSPFNQNGAYDAAANFWDLETSHNAMDFELNFWLHLADHPFLAG